MYPWDQWFTGEEVTLHKDLDFNCLPHSFVLQARRRASLLGLRMTARINENSVTLKVKR